MCCASNPIALASISLALLCAITHGSLDFHLKLASGGAMAALDLQKTNQLLSIGKPAFTLFALLLACPSIFQHHPTQRSHSTDIAILRIEGYQEAAHYRLMICDNSRGIDVTEQRSWFSLSNWIRNARLQFMMHQLLSQKRWDHLCTI